LDSNKNFSEAFSEHPIHDHRFKSVIHVPAFELDSLITYSKGDILPRIIKEPALKSSNSMLFPRNHRLFEPFNKVIKEAVTAGIIDHLSGNLKNLINHKRYQKLHFEGFRPMNLDHLKAGFVIWLVAITFPIAAFVAEWIVFGLPKFIFRYIFSSYIKNLEQISRNRGEELQLKIMEKKSTIAEEDYVEDITNKEKETNLENTDTD
jgi:hypothetical protein